MKVLGPRVLLVVLCLLSLATHSTAQNYVYDAGRPVYTTAEPVELGFINLPNGNLHLEIPLTYSPQRGDHQFTAALVYDSRIWRPSSPWSPTNVRAADQTNPSWGGWRLITSADEGKVSHNTIAEPCNPDPPFGGSSFEHVDFSWTSPDGVSHHFPGVFTFNDNCTGLDIPTADGPANDSSGLHIYVTAFFRATVKDRHGRIVYAELTNAPADTNGNYFSGSVAGGNLVDTLGRTPISVSGTNPVIYTVLNSQGTTQQITVTLTNITVSTAFAQSGFTECTNCVITVVQSIQLPDGSTYTFDYDNGAPGTYGLVTGVHLPGAGVINYGYTTFTDAYGNKNRWVSSRTKGSGQWTYTPAVISSCAQGQVGCQQKVTALRPSGDETEYKFTLNNGAWNSEIRAFNGTVAGNVQLQATLTTYDFANGCAPPCFGAQYIRATNIANDVPSSNGTLHKKVQYTYDSPQNGNIISIKEWNFTLGGFGANPDRETAITYETNASYANLNIIDLPLNVTVRDVAAVKVAETLYSYDSTTISPAAGITHHFDTYDPAYTTRGNPTLIRKWIDGTDYRNTTLFYDATGQVVRVDDHKGNQTLFSYADNFYNDGSPATAFTPPVPTNAYPTQVTVPLIGASTLTYYFGTGQLAFATDQNGAQVENHYLDPLSRPTVSHGPSVTGGRAWVLNTYTSATQLDVRTTLNEVTASTGCSSCRHDRLITDTFGRLTQAKVVSDPHPNGPATVDTAYDSSGRVATVSNPHRTVAEPTDGLETPAYDGLNRVTQVTHPDGQIAKTFFGAKVTDAAAGGRGTQKCSGTPGFPIVTLDEAGKKRQTWTDGFDRLIEVDEPDSSGSLTNDATVLFTCYAYDVQNNLLQVTQGVQTRTYTYDKLGRVTSEKIPESGNPQVATNYFYTTTAPPPNNLCSGDPSAVCRRTDPRGITTTYTYDALNRLTVIDYSDTTPDISYFYDQTSYNGLTITNGKGRRTGMSDGSGQTAWSYDAAGNPLAVRKTINGSPNQTNTVSYTYNLNGSVASLTYPSGRIVEYLYNNAFQPLSAKTPPAPATTPAARYMLRTRP